jgi:hypothetical protein
MTRQQERGYLYNVSSKLQTKNIVSLNKQKERSRDRISESLMRILSGISMAMFDLISRLRTMPLHILFFNHTGTVFTSLGQYSGLPLFNKPRSNTLYFLEGAIEGTRACHWLPKREIYSAFWLERARYLR